MRDKISSLEMKIYTQKCFSTNSGTFLISESPNYRKPLQSFVHFFVNNPMEFVDPPQAIDRSQFLSKIEIGHFCDNADNRLSSQYIPIKQGFLHSKVVGNQNSYIIRSNGPCSIRNNREATRRPNGLVDRLLLAPRCHSNLMAFILGFRSVHLVGCDPPVEDEREAFLFSEPAYYDRDSERLDFRAIALII